MIAFLVDNGLVALIAVAVLLAEIVALAFFLPNGGFGRFAWNTLAGLGLLGALYFSLVSGSRLLLLLMLGIGFAGHLGDLIGRLRREFPKTATT
jgi:hypothetical protein